MARPRIDRNTKLPIVPRRGMHQRMIDMRNELGKSITKSYDEHNNALAQMWMHHSNINSINS